jgi:hypothetical protein
MKRHNNTKHNADMTSDKLKTQLELLLRAVVEAALSTNTELLRLQGVALFDMRKDSLITAHSHFPVLESGIRELKNVSEQCGIEQSGRIALQLVYEYFARADVVMFDQLLLDKLWADFVAELDTPVWRTRSVTNLRYFESNEIRIDLCDGVTIYRRDRNVLKELGFHSALLDLLVDDWSRFGASSFVLVAESEVPKRPQNFISVDGSVVWARCARAIKAMRLVSPGDVGISETFFQRAAYFNVGIGGITSSGRTIDSIGSQYNWSSANSAAYKSTYKALKQLENNGTNEFPGNLDLALRAFMYTYDRSPTAADMKLVDSITSLEAVLGSKSEITFKLSFRVASFLASTDEERSTLLRSMKGFYDARSCIVHGSPMKDKHKKSLAAVDDLRDMVRTLIYSFVRFAGSDLPAFGKQFFDEELDAELISAKSRDDLRKRLRLIEPI